MYIRRLRDYKNRKKPYAPKDQQVKVHHDLNMWQKIYNSKEWKHLRRSYISEHPLCEECLKNGKVTPAQEVHHIVKFSTGKTEAEVKSLAYDETNLMSLCSKCHKEKHKHDHHNRVKEN